jgi:N-acetylglutamate synthase-like GNAT family acetyltransferase
METGKRAEAHAAEPAGFAGVMDFFVSSPRNHVKTRAMKPTMQSDPSGVSNDSPHIEPATIEDLPALTELVMDLMSRSGDFTPDRAAQERGLRLILEQPNRGRIFVVRNKDKIFGMVNLLFTISTARGGFVILMEDVVIHPVHRGQGYGRMLVDYVVDFAKQKNFKRITLLTDKMSAESQEFFRKQGFEYSNMIPMRRIID